MGEISTNHWQVYLIHADVDERPFGAGGATVLARNAGEALTVFCRAYEEHTGVAVASGGIKSVTTIATGVIVDNAMVWDHVSTLSTDMGSVPNNLAPPSDQVLPPVSLMTEGPVDVVDSINPCDTCYYYQVSRGFLKSDARICVRGKAVDVTGVCDGWVNMDRDGGSAT